MNKGVYCLVLNTSGTRLRVGARGDLAFPCGWYVYVGSALGTGGLSRVVRHIQIHIFTWETQMAYRLPALLS